MYGCQQSKTAPAFSASEKWQQLRLRTYQDSVYPAINKLVQNGDMVTRLGSDITSEMLRTLNLTDQSFSHCGIASVENDTVFVYHAIGGEFNPDQKVKREPLYSFGHSVDNKAIGIFRPGANSSQKEQVVQLARHAWLHEVKFDMKFDYLEDERQYCAEFVAKSFVRGLSDSSWLGFSSKGNFSYVAVDNLFRNSLMKEIVRYSY
jgi:hypothetical protein